MTDDVTTISCSQQLGISWTCSNSKGLTYCQDSPLLKDQILQAEEDQATSCKVFWECPTQVGCSCTQGQALRPADCRKRIKSRTVCAVKKLSASVLCNMTAATGCERPSTAWWLSNCTQLECSPSKPDCTLASSDRLVAALGPASMTSRDAASPVWQLWAQ